jgi:dynein heavy chain
MSELASESGPATPLFFVLFPGVDPTPEVEKMALENGKSLANGKLTIISMGQG